MTIRSLAVGGWRLIEGEDISRQLRFVDLLTLETYHTPTSCLNLLLERHWRRLGVLTAGTA